MFIGNNQSAIVILYIGEHEGLQGELTKEMSLFEYFKLSVMKLTCNHWIV